MRGRTFWHGLAIVLICNAFAHASDVTTTLSQAQRAIEQQQFTVAIAILEKALPDSQGDERVLSLLRRAYRGAIPRLVQLEDRAAAQRYSERLRLLEADMPSRDRSARSQLPTQPDKVNVIVPDGSGLVTGSSEHLSWRPASQAIARDPARQVTENRAAAPSARVISAQPPAVPTTQKLENVTDPTARLDPRSAEQARQFVTQADALFVAQRYSEAEELYEQANRTAPETLSVARERWVYCRLARTVSEINDVPASPSRWSAIKTELQSVLEQVPGNAFAQSLLAVADRQIRDVNVAASGRERIIRASEPEAGDASQASLLRGLAARIGRDAGNPGRRSLWKRFRSGSGHVLETSNFRVHATDQQIAGQVADIAEASRTELYKTWYGKLPDSNWAPKCDIFIHDSPEQYARITHQGPASPGHSQTSVEHNRIASRRIDLRRDGNDVIHAVLPHEVTHVVLADRFTSRPMPRWADEGIAVLTEPSDKKNGHLKNLGDFLNQGRVFTARQLMTMDDYPGANQWPMFYAESVSLVEFLVYRGGPSKFIEFMEASLKNGYERELNRVYNLSGFDELDKAWSLGRVDQVALASGIGD